jgi:hypothetical protein
MGPRRQKQLSLGWTVQPMKSTCPTGMLRAYAALLPAGCPTRVRSVEEQGEVATRRRHPLMGLTTEPSELGLRQTISRSVRVGESRLMWFSSTAKLVIDRSVKKTSKVRRQVGLLSFKDGLRFCRDDISVMSCSKIRCRAQERRPVQFRTARSAAPTLERGSWYDSRAHNWQCDNPRQRNPETVQYAPITLLSTPAGCRPVTIVGRASVKLGGAQRTCRS